MDFFERLEPIRMRWDVLRHPFYTRWEHGELTGDELAYYADEYRHAVVALADAAATAGEHADEEREHVALLDDFARAAGAGKARPPRGETEACVQAWSGGDELESLAVLYAIESTQPEISNTKLCGLVDHYGFEEGPATEYFRLHAELDSEHAAEARAAITQRAAEADSERLLAAAEAALAGNWTLLDGVEREFGR
jgi:pyrroloquinoline-quinone synthase